MDTPEKIVVVKIVVTLHIDDSKETFGQETDDLEPGFLTVSQTDVTCNYSNGILVCRQRLNHHFQNARGFVGLPEFSMNIGKGADEHGTLPDRVHIWKKDVNFTSKKQKKHLRFLVSA